MKITKRILALVLVLAVCFALSGCMSLDEMRERHAFWTDESHTAIEWNGETYKLLPENEWLDAGDHFEQIYVTDKGVPVLLSESYGQRYNAFDNGIFIKMFGECFCRSDKFDEMYNRIVTGVELDTYFYEYRDSNEQKQYALTDEQVSAIESVMVEENRQVIASFPVYEYDYSIGIYLGSEDYWFRKSVFNIYCDFEFVGDEERKDDLDYVIDNLERKGYYIVTGDPNGSAVYPVPEELETIFDEIVYEYNNR